MNEEQKVEEEQCRYRLEAHGLELFLLSEDVLLRHTQVFALLLQPSLKQFQLLWSIVPSFTEQPAGAEHCVTMYVLTVDAGIPLLT